MDMTPALGQRAVRRDELSALGRIWHRHCSVWLAAVPPAAVGACPSTSSVPSSRIVRGGRESVALYGSRTPPALTSVTSWSNASMHVRIAFAVLGIVTAQGVEQVFPGQPIHHFGVRQGSERSAGLNRDLLRMFFGFVVDQEGQNRQLLVDDTGNITATVEDHAQDADVLVGAAQHHRRRFFCPGEDPQKGPGIVQRLTGLGLDGWR
jgi:hypothetical protein